MNQMRHPGSMRAALGLIQSCIHNGEFEDAEHYARHAMFMINDMTDNFIPANQQPKFLTEGSYWLARAILSLAKAGGIPPKEKQKAGEEAIAHARKALKTYTQLHGTENADVAGAMITLADVLDYFNDVDDDEVLCLREQSIAIYRRMEGSSSLNVAVGEFHFGMMYGMRVMRAQAANDLDRCATNYELALPHFHEGVRIFRVINRVDMVDEALRNIDVIEDKIRHVGVARTSSASAASALAIVAVAVAVVAVAVTVAVAMTTN